jgi:hypothetical protein
MLSQYAIENAKPENKYSKAKLQKKAEKEKKRLEVINSLAKNNLFPFTLYLSNYLKNIIKQTFLERSPYNTRE